MTQVLRTPYFHPPGSRQIPPAAIPGSQPGAPARNPAPPSGARTPAPLARLLVKREDRLIVVRLEDVEWIESAGNYVRLHAAGQAHLLRQTLGGLAARLDPRRFVQVHRTAIVNLDAILELLRPAIASGRRYALRLRDGRELPVSRRFRRRLIAAVGQA